jgi:salicylate hydroxylase
MPFSIAIVGAGISGLAAAIALARDGHTVNVFERRANTQQASGSGLQIQPSAIKILKRWNLLDGFRKVAHESGSLKLMRYEDGKLIAEQIRKGPRG